MELWASTDDGFPEEGLYEQLCKIKEADTSMYRPYFVFRKEREAVQHLFWLAGGLKSRILGEDQIVTQVGEALSFAREQYATDSVMETLFRMAVTAAKKVKTEVELSHTDNSVVRTAIDTLRKTGADLCRKEMYGHRQRCHGKADRDDAPGRRGGCHGDGTAVPEWYRRDSAWL